MLGMVFTEFIEMVEVTFSAETVDELLEDCGPNLASGGAYTSVGYYHHDEMLALVSKLADMTGIPAPRLVYLYGNHLFGRFHARYPVFFEQIDGTFPFLESVHKHIHVEVRKLYSDTRPPSLTCRREGGGRLIVEYRSDRPFAVLAHGLIDGCIRHYGEDIALTVIETAEDGRGAIFGLDRGAGDAVPTAGPKAP